MRSSKDLTPWLQDRLPEALDLLRRMVETNSWTQNPDGVRRVGDLTEEAFRGLGLKAERVPSSNPEWGPHLVLTRAGTGEGTLACVSHLDTVFPPEEEERNQFHWQPEGDRIYGPGTHDIKGGTLVLWLTLMALREFEPEAFGKVTWKLFWNSSEEMLSPDFETVCTQRLGPDTRGVLVFEAEGKGPRGPRLVVARKGRGTWRLRVNGRSAHAGVRPTAGANAIVQLGRLMDRIHAINDGSRQLTVNAGLIRGGTGLNRVPQSAEAEGEFRAFTQEAYQHGRDALLALSGPGDVQSPVDGFRCQVEMEILTETAPWPRNPGTDGLFAHWEAAGHDLGIEVGAESRGGLSDGNHLCAHFPTLDGLGPSGDNDHCSERSADGTKLPEYVDRGSFVPKAALNVVALTRWIRSMPS